MGRQGAGGEPADKRGGPQLSQPPGKQRPARGRVLWRAGVCLHPPRSQRYGWTLGRRRARFPCKIMVPCMCMYAYVSLPMRPFDVVLRRECVHSAQSWHNFTCMDVRTCSFPGIRDTTANTMYICMYRTV